MALAIPGYELQEQIAGTGDTLVHKARELRSGRACTLTILKTTAVLSPEQEQRQMRFLEEGRLLLGLQHPHVIRTFDVGSGEGVSWIAQEQIDGVNLQELLEEQGKSLGMEQVFAIGVQLGWALAELGERDMVHRDVTTANVLLASDGVARLTGFGLNVESSYDRLSTGQAPLGSVDFLSPEQVEGDLPLTPKTDVYGLGALLYRCLAGRVPHSGATLFTRLRAIAHDAPPDLRELNPDVADQLAEVINRFMEWDADDRPLSQDIAPMLIRVASDLGVGDEEWREVVADLVARIRGSEQQQEPASSSRLIIRLRGTDRTIEKSLETGDFFEVGRAQDAALPLRFGWISRRHARIEKTTSGILLSDLRSANGTTVNKEKIDKPTYLKTGDLIAFGKSRFEVTVRPGGGPELAGRQCLMCGKELSKDELEGVDETRTCVRCQSRAEVDREAAEHRLQSALEEAHFEVISRLESRGLFRRFRVRRRKKTFLASAIELGSRTAKLFAERSERALSLKHPAILPTLDLQVRSGILIVLSQDHPGQTLDALVSERGPLSPAQTAVLGQVLCDALHYVLERQIPQALVRPDLILVGPDGSPTLLDVGHAPGLVEASRSRQAGPQTQPCYVAPEVRDVRGLTPRAIVFAIGSSLSYALTGNPVAEIRDGERYDNLPLTMVPTIPAHLASLLSKSTAPNPLDRPASPAQLRDALSAVLEQIPGAGLRMVDPPTGGKTHRLSRDELHDDEVTRPPGGAQFVLFDDE